MATTSSNVPKSTAKAPKAAEPSSKPNATRSTARKTGRTARKPAATRSTTRATKAPATAGRTRATKAPASARRSRTTAADKTRVAARANVRAAETTAKVTADETRSIAERAALTYVGATLEARDRVVGAVGEIVDRYGSPAAAEKELRGEFKRFERRGSTARTRLERSARMTRTRLERELRERRRGAERLVRPYRTRAERGIAGAHRDAERRPNLVTQRVDSVSNRVEEAVQATVATGERVVAIAREQVKTRV